MKHNPISLAATKEWTQGIGWQDVTAAALGLAASTTIPNMVVKDRSKMTGKLLALVVGFASAVGAGVVARSIFSQKAGQAAIAGGLAGTTLQGLSSLANIKLGEPGVVSVARQLGAGYGIRAGEVVSPSRTRDGETVQTIYP